MKRNYNFDDELKNPMNVAIFGGVMIIVVLLFCVIVWNVTHNEEKFVASNKTEQTEDSKVVSSSQEESTDIVVATPEPSEDENADFASVEALIAALSNDSGVEFTETNDIVTARGVTNLRSEPSTAQAEATVVTQLHNGVNALRVGYNEEVGWSKLIYEDQVLYASTAYLVVVEEAE